MGEVTNIVQSVGRVQLNIQYYLGLLFMVIAGLAAIYFMLFYKNDSMNIDENGKEKKLSRGTGIMISGIFGLIGLFIHMMASFERKDKTFQTISGVDTIAQGISNLLDDK